MSYEWCVVSCLKHSNQPNLHSFSGLEAQSFRKLNPCWKMVMCPSSPLEEGVQQGAGPAQPHRAAVGAVGGVFAGFELF